MFNDDQKRCPGCSQLFESASEYFYWDSQRQRYYGRCKACHKTSVEKSRRQARERARDRRERLRQEDPVKAKLTGIRQRLAQKHRRRGYDGDAITLEQLSALYHQQDGKCFYTGLEYSLDEQGPLLMSVERINSSLGYTVENVVLCCWFVNCAKNSWPLNDMKQLWKYLPTD